MKEINLERILENQHPYYHKWKLRFSENEINFILDAMKDACNQTVLLCDENVRIICENSDDEIPCCSECDYHYIDHDSILDTKNQIK